MDNVHDTVQRSILTARHLRLTITIAKVVITESYMMSLREGIIKTSFVPNVMKTGDGNLSVGQDLRFSVFTSVQSRFSSFFFGCFNFRMRGNLLKYMININFSSFSERPTETSRRNTVSRHRDNEHVYDK